MLRRFVKLFPILILIGVSGYIAPAVQAQIVFTAAWSDNFTNSPASGSRSVTFPTTAGSAGSSTAVENTWVDVHGGVWLLSASGVLQCTNDSSNGNVYQPDYLTWHASYSPYTSLSGTFGWYVGQITGP